MATYRPGRVAAFRALWQALTRGGRPGGPGVFERLRALPRMLGAAASGRYRDLGRGRLAMLVLAIAYLASPIDLVPELFLPLIGLGDDAVVALWLAGTVLAETDRFLGWEKDRPAVDPRAH